MTNEKNCILSQNCTKAGTDSCTKICPYFISIKGRLDQANIPKDYQKYTIKNNPVRTTQVDAFEKIDLWAKLSFPRMFIEEGERIRPLYLYSQEPGTGKTSAACAIANSYLVYHFVEGLKRDYHPLESVVYFLDFNAWQRLFSEFNHPSIPKDIKEKQARHFYTQREIAKRVPLLILDDIGIQPPTEAFGAVAHDLINHRVSNRMPTVFTSNVRMEDLLLSYDKRLYDRVRDQNTEIIFEGMSNRGKRRDYN